MFESVALGGALLFCVARSVFDFRARRWGWGTAGLIVAVALLFVPVQTQAIKIDLPAGSR